MLAAPHGPVGPLVVTVGEIGHPDFQGLRARAVDRLGDDRLDSEEARAMLRKLQEGGPNPLKLRAAASLVLPRTVLGPRPVGRDRRTQSRLREEVGHGGHVSRHGCHLVPVGGEGTRREGAGEA